MSFTRFWKIFLALFFAVALTLSAAGCGNKLASTKEESATVLTIDGIEVPYEQLRYVVRNYMAVLGDETFWTEEKAAELSEEVFRECFEILKEQYAVVALAKEYGISKEDAGIKDRVDAYMETVITDFGSEDAYLAALRAGNMTDAVYRFFLTVTVLEEELFYAMQATGDIETDPAALTAIVKGDEFVRVKQILISNDAGDVASENRKKAEEACQRAKAGEDFDALVTEYGEDLYMFSNTDGYYLCQGVWYHEFEDAAFALAVGEVSDVIETPAGYSVLLRCEKDDEYINNHLTTLFEDYKESRLSLTIEEKIEKLTVTTNETFDKYTLLTID